MINFSVSTQLDTHEVGPNSFTYLYDLSNEGYIENSFSI